MAAWAHSNCGKHYHALSHRSNGIEFNLIAIVQFADRHHGTGRAVVAEELGVNAIDHGPVFDVAHIDGHAEYLLPAAACCNQDGIEVGESLPGLLIDAADKVFLLTRPDGQLTGNIDDTLMDDSLGIMPGGDGGFVGEDGLQGHGLFHENILVLPMVARLPEYAMPL